ncbi:hypothetical protein ABPG72_003239 [Tetrahymena utriculariae]
MIQANSNEHAQQGVLIHVADTALGLIQYGIPPMTVSQTLNIYNQVPTYFILPQKQFNKENGMLLVDLEQPVRYNALKCHKITTIICAEEEVEDIQCYIQESFLGPQNIKREELKHQFHTSFDQEGIPQFEKEQQYIYKHLLGIKDNIDINYFVRFAYYDKDGCVSLGRGVDIENNGKRVNIMENSKVKQIIDIEETENQIFQYLLDIETQQELLIHQRMVQSEQIIDESSEAKLSTENDKNKHDFIPPLFNYTGLSSPFDSSKPSGFIIWINGRAGLVDPPIFTTNYLQSHYIPTNIIDWVILTNCHSECDIGVLQRFVESSRMEIISTPTIINSFINKYSRICKINNELMRRLFKFKPVVIGAAINLNGCVIRFHYNFHVIPSIGFEINNQNASIYYSGYNLYDPKLFSAISKKQVITMKRFELLANTKFIHNRILFDAGNPIAHTQLSILQQLPQQTHKNIRLIYTDENSLPNEYKSSFQISSIGLQYTQTEDPDLKVKKHKALDYMMKLEILSQVDVFEGISLKNLRDLIDIANEEFFTKGQYVIKQNTLGNKWYIILKGSVKVFSEKKIFEDRIFSVGEYFGESALILEQQQGQSQRRMASVQALSDLHVLTLEKQDFWFAFGQGKESSGLKILQKQQRLLHSRINKSIQIIEHNSFLKDLNETQKTQLEMILINQEAKRDQLMWRVGDQAKFGIIVKSGQFKFVDCPEADINIEITKGFFVGEISSLINESENTTSLQAISDDCAFFKIDRHDLIGFLRRNPGLFLAFGDSKYFI